MSRTAGPRPSASSGQSHHDQPVAPTASGRDRCRGWLDARAEMSRRAVLRSAALAAGVTGGWSQLSSPASAATPAASGRTLQVDPAGEMRWLGPDLWGNRLADWARRGSTWVCVAGLGRRRLCTASVLTRRLTGGPARLSIAVTADQGGRGFGGFLVGTGADAEHRRTAMVSTVSGTGGGFLAVLADDGRVAFREHTDEDDQNVFAPLPCEQSEPSRGCRAGETLTVTLRVVPQAGSADVDLTLIATDARGVELSRARRRAPRSEVQGGIALVSGAGATDGPRWAFDELVIDGDGVDYRPERGLGPIMGTLFSLAAGVLKMTAQVFPMDLDDDDRVLLEARGRDGVWRTKASAAVGVGCVALLRVEGWDASRDTPFRVIHSRGGAYWGGVVPAEPTGQRPVRIATINCSKAARRPFDSPSRSDGMLDGGSELGLYTADNLWFPYEQTLSFVEAQTPDLLVAMGDQYYEDSPTAKDTSQTIGLDFLYKYMMWLWAVRDLARNCPTIVLVDDHDVFQGNLWGEGGIASPGGDFLLGGYAQPADFVNLVQRVQCGHNPDPIDPAPVGEGIDVYFTRFDYAAITFVILEDRKFKTSPDGVDGSPDAPWELLGRRQEAMLAQLAADKGGSGTPVVVLTQTAFSMVATDSSGALLPTIADGAFPRAPRARALSSIKAAGAVMLSGDTHLATMVRHLRVPVADGPLQFTGPALCSAYQRWFAPSDAGGPGGQDVGRFADGAGGAFAVHAVANPRISQAEALRRGTRNIGQRELKREGYGLVVVDAAQRTYRFEAWSGDVDPRAAGSAPYPGWPYVVGFDDA